MFLSILIYCSSFLCFLTNDLCRCLILLCSVCSRFPNFSGTGSMLFYFHDFYLPKFSHALKTHPALSPAAPLSASSPAETVQGEGVSCRAASGGPRGQERTTGPGRGACTGLLRPVALLAPHAPPPHHRSPRPALFELPPLASLPLFCPSPPVSLCQTALAESPTHSVCARFRP